MHLYRAALLDNHKMCLVGATLKFLRLFIRGLLHYNTTNDPLCHEYTNIACWPCLMHTYVSVTWWLWRDHWSRIQGILWGSKYDTPLANVNTYKWHSMHPMPLLHFFSVLVWFCDKLTLQLKRLIQWYTTGAVLNI